MINKVQKFLKSKHKFDRKLSIDDELENLTNSFNNMKESAKTEDPDKVRNAFGQFLVELIKFANNNDILIEDVLTKDLGFNP
jgi:hypothetical protein